MSQIIRTQALSKVFYSQGKAIQAVKDVSFSVQEGQLFGLFGSNGAGKSTIVRMLTTLLQPSSGQALVNGFDTVRQAKQVRTNIGLVTADERAFYGRLTPRQNLRFYAALQNIPRTHIADNIQRVLALFALEHKADVPFQSLSTGQKQRLNMARALIHNPPILFLDEPTKSMDVQTSDFVKSLIKHELVAKQNKTIVFISHELYEMDQFCDQVLILAEGQVRAIGSPAELSIQLPRRAIYRLSVEGPAQKIIQTWQSLPQIEAVELISQGPSLSAFNLTFSDENSAWLAALQAVAQCGGRVEAYSRLNDGSLRDVVRFFSQDDA